MQSLATISLCMKNIVGLYYDILILGTS